MSSSSDHSVMVDAFGGILNDRKKWKLKEKAHIQSKYKKGWCIEFEFWILLKYIIVILNFIKIYNSNFE